MIRDFYLTNFGFTYEAQQMGRDEVEFHLQHYASGVRPNYDYIFQSRPPTTIWQVNGMTPSGAKAAAYVCRGFHFMPNRIDVRCDLYEQGGSIRLRFDEIAARTKKFFKEHKRVETFEQFLKVDLNPRLVIGTRKSRYSLTLEINEVEGLPVISIVWNIRREKVMDVYGYLEAYENAGDYMDNCAKAFAACTNSILRPDFFGIGLYPDEFLPTTTKTDIHVDWWGEVSAFCQKIVKQAEKEKSYFLVEETFRFMEKELGSAIERKARKYQPFVVEFDKKDNITI